MIGDNCFIGAKSTILYGVELADNIIVAAGSVVTKSFKNKNVIIAGNPARVINDWDNYSTKILNYALSTKGLSYNEKKDMILSSEKLVERQP